MSTTTKRSSYYLPGMAHTNPIPTATKKGPLLVSGGLAGMDPATGGYCEGIEAQMAKMFENIAAVMAMAGGTVEDIVKVAVYLPSRDLRPHVNNEWVKMFPDEHSRPARHTFNNPDLPKGCLVQCEIMAWVD
jgi:2-iminobutanoate/2-iminopropanoate deaminase